MIRYCSHSLAWYCALHYLYSDLVGEYAAFVAFIPLHDILLFACWVGVHIWGVWFFPPLHFTLVLPFLVRLSLCLFLPPHLPCPSQVVLMVVWTTKTVFPLLLILLNLESHLCWMDVNLTIMANPLSDSSPPTPQPSNSEWEVTIVLMCPLLSQNFVLNFEKFSLQGSFP